MGRSGKGAVEEQPEVVGSAAWTRSSGEASEGRSRKKGNRRHKEGPSQGEQGIRRGEERRPAAYPATPSGHGPCGGVASPRRHAGTVVQGGR